MQEHKAVSPTAVHFVSRGSGGEVQFFGATLWPSKCPGTVDVGGHWNGVDGPALAVANVEISPGPHRTVLGNVALYTLRVGGERGLKVLGHSFLGHNQNQRGRVGGTVSGV